MKYLFERIAARDESALKALHAIMAPRLHAYALCRLHTEASADRVVMETFLELWRSPARVGNDTQASDWIIAIARRKTLAEWRRANPPDLVEGDDESTRDVQASADEIEALSRYQNPAHVAQCMRAMSRKQRESLFLVFREGLSLPEIASLQRSSTVSVKAQLTAALQAMKGSLLHRISEEGHDVLAGS